MDYQKMCSSLTSGDFTGRNMMSNYVTFVWDQYSAWQDNPGSTLTPHCLQQKHCSFCSSPSFFSTDNFFGSKRQRPRTSEECDVQIVHHGHGREKRGGYCHPYPLLLAPPPRTLCTIVKIMYCELRIAARTGKQHFNISVCTSFSAPNIRTAIFTRLLFPSRRILMFQY